MGSLSTCPAVEQRQALTRYPWVSAHAQRARDHPRGPAPRAGGGARRPGV